MLFGHYSTGSPSPPREGIVETKGESVVCEKDKVVVIQDWPGSTKVIELHYFLELANYYRWFIKGYSKIIIPLTNLLKKERDGNGNWSSRLPSKGSKTQ
ncbi:hypothetical protein AAG906_020676 [Vitis piasezkii]